MEEKVEAMLHQIHNGYFQLVAYKGNERLKMLYDSKPTKKGIKDYLQDKFGSQIKIVWH